MIPIKDNDFKPVSIGGKQFTPANPMNIGGKQYIPLTPVKKDDLNKTKINLDK